MQVCLLEGLHAVTDGELPMLTSDFYAKYMLPAKPEGGCMPLGYGGLRHTMLHSFLCLPGPP